MELLRPHLDPRLLNKLSGEADGQEPDPWDGYASEETLDMLAREGDRKVQQAVASNPATPARTHRVLAESPHPEVRKISELALELYGDHSQMQILDGACVPAWRRVNAVRQLDQLGTRVRLDRTLEAAVMDLDEQQLAQVLDAVVRKLPIHEKTLALLYPLNGPVGPSTAWADFLEYVFDEMMYKRSKLHYELGASPDLTWLRDFAQKAADAGSRTSGWVRAGAWQSEPGALLELAEAQDWAGNLSLQGLLATHPNLPEEAVKLVLPRLAGRVLPSQLGQFTWYGTEVFFQAARDLPWPRTALSALTDQRAGRASADMVRALGRQLGLLAGQPVPEGFYRLGLLEEEDLVAILQEQGVSAVAALLDHPQAGPKLAAQASFLPLSMAPYQTVGQMTGLEKAGQVSWQAAYKLLDAGEPPLFVQMALNRLGQEIGASTDRYLIAQELANRFEGSIEQFCHLVADTAK